MDYYNSNLDVFLDTPIVGVRYPLQLLFDYEDRHIEECRRKVAESRRIAKKPKPKRVRQKEVVSEDEEEKRARGRRERELAAALFADDAAPKQKTSEQRRLQMDDEELLKNGLPSDWDEELFGPWVPDSPEKQDVAVAPVAPTAMMMHPRSTASASKVSTPRNRTASYSVPPLRGERIAGRNRNFSPYKSPKDSNRNQVGNFDPLFDVSPESQEKARTPAKASILASEPPSSRQVTVSGFQQIDMDGDIPIANTADATKNESAPIDLSMDDIPAAEPTSQTRQRQQSEVTEPACQTPAMADRD